MTKQELQEKIAKMQKGLDNPAIQGDARTALAAALESAKKEFDQLDDFYDSIDKTEKQLKQYSKQKEVPVKPKVSFSDYPLAAKFMPKHQKNLVQRYDDDDKKGILEEIEKNLRQLGGYGSQDGKGRAAMVFAHYFWGKSDWFITETDFDEDAENLFGFTILNGDTEMAELGATSLDDLVNNGRIELDFYWTPVTLREALHKADPDYFELNQPENKEKQDDKFDITSIPHTEDGYQKIKDHISQNRNAIPARDLIFFGEVADNIRQHLDKKPVVDAEPSPAINSVICNVTRNLKQNGIEIKFPKQPSDDIAARIKSKGFRWSKFQKLWYVKYSESLHQFAIDICGETEHSDTPATMPLHAPNDPNVRLITLAVLTSKGKVPQGILRDEINAGKLEMAIYKKFNGMDDSTDYLADTELQWRDASMSDAAFDIEQLKKNKANSHYTDSIYLDNDGIVSYGNLKFRYKNTVKGHDYNPKIERQNINDIQQLEADIQKKTAEKVIDLVADQYHVPFNRLVQHGKFKIADGEILDPNLYVDKGEMPGIVEIDGYRLAGTMEAKNIVTSVMMAVFGGQKTENRENRWIFKSEPGTSVPAYLSLWSRYRELRDGESSDFPKWRFNSFPTAVWASLRYAAREAIAERDKMNQPKKSDRAKKIHQGKMNEAVTRINLIKKIWVAYEQDQPGLLFQVTGQDQDEYNQMLALWRADLGLKEGSPMMVVRASGADQDEKHTAQLKHETLLPLKTKMEDTNAKIEAVTAEIEAVTAEIETSGKQVDFKILGKKRQITLPNGEKHDAQYAIVELDTILASHHEETFADTKGYPRNSLGGNLNDRNYATDKGAQQLVEEYARNLNPDLVIALTSTPEGTPIITPNGIVVSGNNRTMSLKLARKKYDAKWREYQAALQNESDVFGFDQSALDNLAEMSAPVLVRIDSDFGDLTTTNMAKYNASSMKGKSPVDRAAELATTLREQILCETNIPKIIGDFDTLSDFYADRSAVKRMVSAMQQCSVLNEQDMPAYVENGYFTEDGKTLLETILASLILEPDTLRIANRDGVRSFRQAIVNALPVLIANKNLDTSAILIPHINAAIRYQGEVIASGLGWENFVNQVNMFSDDRAECNTVYINRLMNEGQRIFRDAIRKYNDSQAHAGDNALFAAEVVSPDEAFKGYIIGRLPKEVVQRVQRYCEPPKANKTEPDKTKMAKLRLKLLEKSEGRLDGDKKKLAATRIKLLTKYLSK
jgi:hypothetical protein